MTERETWEQLTDLTHDQYGGWSDGGAQPLEPVARRPFAVLELVAMSCADALRGFSFQDAQRAAVEPLWHRLQRHRSLLRRAWLRSSQLCAQEQRLRECARYLPPVARWRRGRTSLPFECLLGVLHFLVTRQTTIAFPALLGPPLEAPGLPQGMQTMLCRMVLERRIEKEGEALRDVGSELLLMSSQARVALPAAARATRVATERASHCYLSLAPFALEPVTVIFAGELAKDPDDGDEDVPRDEEVVDDRGPDADWARWISG